MERKGGSTTVVTAETVAAALTKSTTVTAREEQVLRMRYGATVEKTTTLPQAHEGNEELEDELLLIEMALLRAVKRRAEQQKAARAPKNAAKDKIVRALKTKKK